MQLERQLKIALAESRLLILGAQVLFGFQFALDTYVAAGPSLQSDAGAMALAVSAALVLLGVWYVYALWRRMRAT